MLGCELFWSSQRFSATLRPRPSRSPRNRSAANCRMARLICPRKAWRCQGVGRHNLRTGAIETLFTQSVVEDQHKHGREGLLPPDAFLSCEVLGFLLDGRHERVRPAESSPPQEHPASSSSFSAINDDVTLIKGRFVQSHRGLSHHSSDHRASSSVATHGLLSVGHALVCPH